MRKSIQVGLIGAITIVLMTAMSSFTLFAQTEPILKVEPLVLDYGWTLNSLQLRITNSGGDTLTWTADENPSNEWIVINHNNSLLTKYKITSKSKKPTAVVNSTDGSLGPNESADLEVVVDRQNLFEGSNYGEIVITSNAGNQSVDVIVEVGNTPSEPILHLNPHVLDFNIGLTNLKFTIKNRGVGALNWNANNNPNQDWITSISPGSGNLESMAEEEVSVTVDRSSLSEGFYSGLISISSNVGNDQVEVELIVGDRPSQIRANVGGFSYTAQNTNVFSTDRPYREGGWGAVRGHEYTLDSDISGTEDDLLYQTERFWIDGYRFDQNNGYYTVILHFAELYYDYEGGRIFDTYIEDELVLNHFDIYAEAGFQTATTRTFNNIYVADGRLDIDFVHHQAHAKLSAIEIISEDVGEPQLSVNPTDLNFGTTETTISFTITNSGGGTLQWQANENPDEPWITSISPSYGNLIANQSETVTLEISREGMEAGDYTGNITVSSNGGDQDIGVNMAVISGSSYIKRVDCGGDQNYTDYTGEIWEADQSYFPGGWGYIGGETYSTSDEIANTNDDILYQSERWGLTSYNFDVENGVYEVKLMFAEIYFKTTGKRVFNVNIEGEQVLTEYDIYAEAGHDNATFHIFTTEVNDGQLNIDFISDIEDPKISAIQVISKSTSPILSVTPTTLDFGLSDTSMTFEITNSSGGTLEWEAAENPDEPWITSVSPVNGTLAGEESQVITVAVDRNGMNEGEYLGTITITSNGGEQDVSIRMTVPSAPLLSISPDTLDFGTTTTSLTFTVSNEGGETLNWSAFENPDEQWITSVNPTSGSLEVGESQAVTVNVDRADLEDGEYIGTITVTSNGGDQNIIIKMTVTTQATYVQRVNCGGSSYIDISGNPWDADKAYTSGSWGYTAGSTYSTNDPINDTEDDFLYQSERWDESFSYRFDVSNGSYHVTLHFAEIYYRRKNIRVFDVSIENQKLINNYDIYADVGHDAATSRSFVIDVSDGFLDIDFVADKNAAKISAIEVIATTQEPQLSVTPTTLDFGSSATSMTFEVKNSGGGTLDWEAAENPDESWISSLNPTSGNLLANQSTTVTVNVDRVDLEDGEYFGTITVTSNGGDQNIIVKMTVTTQSTYVQRVNCGGSSYTDVSNNLWDADRSYTSGSWGYIAGNIYSTPDPIYNTPDDILYQTERWGLQGYQFDVENGQYEVTLRFAEIYLSAPGERVFDVQIEGNTVLSDFDIYAEAGHDNALNKTFIINVNDNQLNINFIKGIEDPKISAIQVMTYQEGHYLEKLVQQDTNPIIENIPGEFKLYNNYPNPFNPSTTISFDLPFEAQVKLSIFNMLGQQVAILMDGILAAGSHLYNWQATNEFGEPLPSGVYLYRIEVRSNSAEKNRSFFITKKMSLTK